LDDRWEAHQQQYSLGQEKPTRPSILFGIQKVIEKSFDDIVEIGWTLIYAFGIGEREDRQAFRCVLLSNGCFERICGVLIAIGSEQEIAMVLTKLPNSLVFCGPIKAYIFKMQESKV
jgi:hypothetical protein